MDILLGLALSQHLNMQGDYNSIHPHIRLEQNSFIGGAYYNSEERISPYIGLRYEFLDNGIELGVAGGYPALGTVVPYGRYTYDLNDSIRLFAAPGGEKVEGETKYGIVVGIELLAF
jgi:hypothetical protein